MASSKQSFVSGEDVSCSICISSNISKKCNKWVMEGDKEVKADCGICDNSTSWQVILQPCGHKSFHACCIKEWLRTSGCSRTCPLCRAPIEIVQHNFSEDGTNMSYRPRPAILPYSLSMPLPTRVENFIIKRRGVYTRRTPSIAFDGRLFPEQRVTPESVTNSIDIQSKILMFAKRDLEVLTSIAPHIEGCLPPSTTNEPLQPILDIIINMLKSMDFQEDKEAMERVLGQYLCQYASLFLHELRAWIESPYDALDEWDRNVVYNPIVARRPPMVRRSGNASIFVPQMPSPPPGSPLSPIQSALQVPNGQALTYSVGD